MDVSGEGYAVVESLSSLGKGRRLTGLVVVATEAVDGLRRAAEDRRDVVFRGLVHHRHRSSDAEVRVRITGFHPEAGGGVRVEFASWEVPYDIAG